MRVRNAGGRLVLTTNGQWDRELTPMGELRFRLGDGETVHFDVVLDGQAQRATIGGGVYARVDAD